MKELEDYTEEQDLLEEEHNTRYSVKTFLEQEDIKEMLEKELEDYYG